MPMTSSWSHGSAMTPSGHDDLAGQPERHVAMRHALGHPAARADDDVDVDARVTLGEALEDRAAARSCPASSRRQASACRARRRAARAAPPACHRACRARAARGGDDLAGLGQRAGAAVASRRASRRPPPRASSGAWSPTAGPSGTRPRRPRSNRGGAARRAAAAAAGSSASTIPEEKAMHANLRLAAYARPT